MKRFFIPLILLLLTSFCGGSWVAAHPGLTIMMSCDKAAKDIKSGDTTFADQACGFTGKVYAGDVRCSASGSLEVKCK